MMQPTKNETQAQCDEMMKRIHPNTGGCALLKKREVRKIEYHMIPYLLRFHYQLMKYAEQQVSWAHRSKYPTKLLKVYTKGITSKEEMLI
mmetsp:Transcript_13810/g.40376  ORF Transcript_13810/g.40376 Transcript_13810/m.40376 type:complete len:90 (+) Transcript_13810:2897-3166(+)